MSDLISRADALKEIEANIKANEKCASDEWLAGQHYAMDAIKRLASVEPRRGKWIRKDLGGWHCDQCGEQAPFWCFSVAQNASNFCPNCGARMEMRGE